jgi:hypothetical protein
MMCFPSAFLNVGIPRNATTTSSASGTAKACAVYAFSVLEL